MKNQKCNHCLYFKMWWICSECDNADSFSDKRKTPQKTLKAARQSTAPVAAHPDSGGVVEASLSGQLTGSIIDKTINRARADHHRQHIRTAAR
jgi:hypothetical protein